MDLGSTASLLLATFLPILLMINVWKKVFKKDKMPPGQTPLPLVGNILQVKSGQVAKSLLKLRDIYGPVFTVYLGCRRVVVLCGCDILKEALIKQGDQFISRGDIPFLQSMLHGSGIGVTNGEQWKQIRRFSVMTLKSLGMGKRSAVQEEAQHMVEKIREHKGDEALDTVEEGEVVQDTEPLPTTSGGRGVVAHEDPLVLQAILPLTQSDSTSDNSFGSGGEPFMASSTLSQLYDMFPKVMDYLPGPHKRMFKHFKYLEDFIAERVKMNQETLDTNCPRDFIDYYLIQKEQGKIPMSERFDIMDLKMTVMDIILGATETTNQTLKYGLLLLLKNPDITEKAQKEIDTVLGERSSPNLEDRQKMPYTNAVVHEIHRFCDTVPMGGCHAVTCDTQFREFVITKGTHILPMLTTALHDPTYFRYPNNFNPENFLDEKGNFVKNEAFVPFSLGKRNCPGLSLAETEVFLILTSIVKNFNLKSTCDLNDLDLTPIESGFENLAPPFKMCFIPR
ncbi:cytochrome P450 2A4-like isoform X1 [Ambystoma mexicanum]|uniref:cytochrome P450 2A4-like isoform X1 n=1 Tax=Ambystoma mexicanum TaxID=8296 RepID=UPI0037E93C70